jgi:hypothetical protein
VLLSYAASMARSGAQVTVLLLLPPSGFASVAAPEPAALAGAAAAETPIDVTLPTESRKSTAEGAPTSSLPLGRSATPLAGLSASLNLRTGSALARLIGAATQQQPTQLQQPAPVPVSVPAPNVTSSTSLLSTAGQERYDAVMLQLAALCGSTDTAGGTASVVCRVQGATDFGAPAVVGVLQVGLDGAVRVARCAPFLASRGMPSFTSTLPRSSLRLCAGCGCTAPPVPAATDK